MESTTSDSLSLGSLSPMSENEDQAQSRPRRMEIAAVAILTMVESRRRLINMLLRDHECGRMSATTVCIVAYWWNWSLRGKV
eukprot:1501243-Amphidinium_carterae.1